jgi:hypothetical protein
VLETERMRLDHIIESAPIAIVVLSGASFRIDRANSKSSELFEEGDVRGRAFEDAFRGSDAAAVLGAFGEAYRTGEARTTPPFTPPSGGRSLEARAVPVRDDFGNVDGLVVYVEPSPT